MIVCRLAHLMTKGTLNYHKTVHVHIFDFTTLFSSCTNDKNNLEQLFNFSTKAIRHTVKTFYCCDIILVTSYFVFILHLSLSINQILFTLRKK